jgi:phospholipase C
MSKELTRRQFLGGVAAAGSLSIARPLLGFQDGRGNADGLVRPENTAIDHIVLVMMENRSFDHFMGWLPGADGRQAGLTYLDRSGGAHHTFPLAPDYQGCGHPDPDHSYAGGRVEFDGGRCDGWLRAGSNDLYAIGYYQQQDLSFIGRQAPHWTTSDRYFAPIMASTYPNRIYQHAAQTDRLDNSPTLSSLPTIWDRLATGGISAHYYYSDVPFLALWGAKYLPISRPFADFLLDAQAGSLPQVSFVDPRFVDESSGTSGDDHPHADIRNGEAFLDLIYKAITTGPAWSRTVLLINYDEWGGFFDHVPPRRAQVPPGDRALGSDGLRGFRVPFVMISPWSASKVSHRHYDHTSVLRLIEWRWNLPPLTIRDASANNPAADLELSDPRVSSPPQFVVPPGPFGTACPLAVTTQTVPDEIDVLRTLAVSHGWPIY